MTTAPPTGTRPEPASDTAARPGAGTSAPAAGRVPGGHASLLRHSGVMAAGTLASRFTGFIRTAVLLYALGTRDLGDAYNVANTVPNAVYNLALGGILTSVAVPLIVSAAKRHSDRGRGLRPADLHPRRAGAGRHHGAGHRRPRCRSRRSTGTACPMPPPIT